MDAEIAPWRSLPARLRMALGAISGACSHATKLALDIALPTLCVSCREPVEGEGVCAECWSRLSFIERPFCPRLGIPFVYDPGPDMLSMEAIANPPAYQRARAIETGCFVFAAAQVDVLVFARVVDGPKAPI